MNRLFVIGSQRSGTTLISSIFAKHPQLCLAVNGKLLYYLMIWIYQNRDHFDALHIRLDEIRFSLERKPILGISLEEKKLLLKKLETLSSKSLEKANCKISYTRLVWELSYSAICAPAHLYIGEKYNEYLFMVEDLMAIFPDAKIIFIYRDPFDVVESMVRAFKDRSWQPEDYSISLRKWMIWNEKWLAVRDQIPVKNRIQLNYSDFINTPDYCLEQTRAFLGVTPFAKEVIEKAEITDKNVNKGAFLHRHFDTKLVDEAAKIYAALGE